MIDNITKLRQVQLNLLKAFSEVCKAHDLKWYAFFGTLLGVVREEGYLPWDDDVDVAMPMEDWLKLCEHREWFDEKRYYLQLPLEPGFSRFAKLRKNGTTAFKGKLVKELQMGGHKGISIDIIPLAEIPGTGCYHTPFVSNTQKQNAVYLKSWFEPAGEGRFEDLTLRMPAKPRKILTELYDPWNWPSGATVCRPTCWFFDTEKGYEYYERRYTGMLGQIEGKKVYLFGAADSMRIWLERFDYRKQVVCTFDNDPRKWGKRVFDIDVRDPSTLPGLLDENSRIIIVSLWHQEIGRQLERMGIEDYYVYLDDYYDEKVGHPVVRREDLPDGRNRIPMWNG